MTEPWFFLILFLTGLVAGLVDSIAGGGGLITLPVLLSLGIPPQEALGTNKLQATFGSTSAAWHYARAKLVSLQDCKRGILFTGIGALGGTLAIQQFDPSFLRKFIPSLLAAIAIILLIQPKIGLTPNRPPMDAPVFYTTFGLLIGFYDGILGPGTGSFWAIAFVMGLGYDLTRATAHTKVMNMTSNVVSLALFLSTRHVLVAAGLAMGLGQLLGARVGSQLAIRQGAAFIRPVFILVVLALTVKLLYDNLT
jgi:uncharacterized membrane protein YfcA